MLNAEPLQSIIKCLTITLEISIIFFLIFFPTINRLPVFRVLFRIGHRITTMMLPVSLPLFFVYVFTISGIMIASKFSSLPFNSFLLAFSLSTKIFLYTLFPALIIHLTCLLIMSILKSTHKIQYERFGILSQWGTKTRAYKRAINWVPVVSEKLLPVLKSLTTNRPTLNILAPAANDGTEELDLAQSFSQLTQRKIRMQTSDASPMKHQKTLNTPTVEFTYEQCDAFELPNKIKELQDIIYDPKGILWFTFGKDKKLLPALQLFYNLLTHDGIVIIDAPDEQKRNQKKNRHRLYFGMKLRYYCESSTYTHIEKAFKPGSAASKLFTLEKVDGLSGPYGMVILRKVPADTLNQRKKEENVG
ncbi:hypothetical protein [Paenibacillus sp. FSL R10-2734]|uniref:hypothetical protein n=1 Tax=Paenibacillus sp. FSL R10-2734 TaxID=2954691 RepID=UPI0030DA557F